MSYCRNEELPSANPDAIARRLVRVGLCLRRLPKRPESLWGECERLRVLAHTFYLPSVMASVKAVRKLRSPLSSACAVCLPASPHPPHCPKIIKKELEIPEGRRTRSSRKLLSAAGAEIARKVLEAISDDLSKPIVPPPK